VVFRLMFVVSGIFFVPAMIPEPYREILLLNPVLHLTEAGRAMFFPNFTQVYGSPIYVIWWILALLFFGMFSDRLVRVRRSRP
jgi:capsular polysaccharide transport system permease protein